MLFALETVTYFGEYIAIPFHFNVIIDCSQIINDAMERYDMGCEL